LADARRDDLKYASAHDLGWVLIWSANGATTVTLPQDAVRSVHAVMTKIAKRLGLRQQITATAIVYLRRFFLKNAYCGAISKLISRISSESTAEIDIATVMGACIYVATKVEELPIHIKTIVQECRTILGGEHQR
jgi:cyclin C